MAESKAPTKYYEVADKKGSGWILDGTKGMVYEQELNTPSILWIPSTGRKAVKAADGKTIEYKNIQYINGCDTLDPEEQKKRGFTDQYGRSLRPMEDKIGVENGFMTVVREGNTITLYDYLEQVLYNADNPLRPDSATAIFREVKLDKNAVQLLDEDELQTQAKALVYDLRQSTGKKDNPYKYNNDRIDAFCKLMNVWDESPERKLILLLQAASQKPKFFLETVVKAEQTVITEVSHCLEMNVIRFEDNVASFTEGNRVLFTAEGNKLKVDQKISQFAAWLSTEEGTKTLSELRAKLEIAKDKSLQ